MPTASSSLSNTALTMTATTGDAIHLTYSTEVLNVDRAVSFAGGVYEAYINGEAVRARQAVERS